MRKLRDREIKTLHVMSHRPTHGAEMAGNERLESGDLAKPVRRGVIL